MNCVRELGNFPYTQLESFEKRTLRLMAHKHEWKIMPLFASLFRINKKLPYFSKHLHFFTFSSMSGAAGSLSSMTSSCLQQAREHHHHHHTSYPYMFPDPLHSLSPTYAHAARVNPAMAHSQPPTTAHHPANYTSTPGTTVPTQATGPGTNPFTFRSWNLSLLSWLFSFL